MKIRVAARHCDLSDSVRERTEEQMEKLTKYHARVSEADVVFSEVKHVRSVEVKLTIHGGEPVIAHGEGEEFRQALDRVVDRLARALRRRRSLRTDHQAPPLSEGVAPGLPE